MKHWHLMKYEEVPDYDFPERTLFRRWRVVETPYCAVYVHHLVKSDSQTRGYHDHPWSFISLRLKGNYTHECLAIGHAPEQDREFTVRHRVFSMVRKGDFHRVRVDDEINGCWTLVLRGRRHNDWGFRLPGGEFISHESKEAELPLYRKREKAHG